MIDWDFTIIEEAGTKILFVSIDDRLGLYNYRRSRDKNIINKYR
jgi:hypothetical protein